MVLLDNADYLVLGGGLSGAVTALLLKQKMPSANIVLLEKQSHIGGVASSHLLQNHYVDSVYMYPDISCFLKYLKINFPTKRNLKNIYSIHFFDQGQITSIQLPTGIQQFEEKLIQYFPEDQFSIKKFWQDCQNINHQFLRLKSKFSFLDLLKFPFTMTKMIRFANKDYQSFLNQYHFKNPLLLKTLQSFAGIGQLSPDRLNTLIPIIAMINLAEKGCVPLQSFQELLNQLDSRLKEEQVKCYFSQKLQSLSKEKHKFKMSLKDGKSIYVNQVISTIDTKNMFQKIVDPDLLSSSFTTKINQLEMTQSCFIIKAIVQPEMDYPCDNGQILFYGGNNTFAFLLEKAENHTDPLHSDIFHFALSVREMEERVYAIEILVVPVSFSYWLKIAKLGRNAYFSEIARWEDFLYRKIAKVIDPDFNQKIISKKIITPIEFQGMYKLSEGNCYDMAQINRQSGNNRFGFTTPIPGLYHNKMILGVYGAFLQSFILVDYLLKGKINQYQYHF
ncbi:MAG: NAD(P)-binding protein [Spirochaetes bacterium]|nr:NAD(P)-binding protein [Spirochaetota bacterium]